MKSINLLPRKAPTEQLFIPLLSMILILTIVGALITYYLGNQTESGILSSESKIAATEQRVHQLSADRQIDSFTQNVNAFMTDISRLKLNRRYWVPFFNAVTSALPNAARIISMNVSNEGTVEIKMNAAGLEDISDYVIRLRQIDIAASVSVKSLTRLDKNSRPAAALAPKATPTPSAVTVTFYDATLHVQLKPIQPQP